MLGNTLALTIGGDPYTLTKINQDGYASEYLFKDSGEEVVAKIRHTKVTKAGVVYHRHNFELRQLVFATPTTDEESRLTYFVIEQRSNDVSIDIPMAGFAMAIATSGAFLTSLQKWES